MFAAAAKECPVMQLTGKLQEFKAYQAWVMWPVASAANASHVSNECAVGF
jgi:hypothetical protein